MLIGDIEFRYSQWMKCTDVARMLGISRQAVHLRLKKYSKELKNDHVHLDGFHFIRKSVIGTKYMGPRGNVGPRSTKYAKV